MRASLLIVLAACGSTAKPAAAPAPAPACDDLRAPAEHVVAAELAAHPGGSRPVAETQHEFSTRLIEACKGDAWSAETIACFARGQRTEDWDACPLTSHQLESLKQRLGGDDDAPPPALDLSPDLGIPACDDYLRAIARALQCPSLDEPARQQLREAVDHQKHEWRAMKPSDAGPSCTLAMDALIKAAKVADCAL